MAPEQTDVAPTKMRFFWPILLGLLLLAVASSAARWWPYLQGSINERKREARMEVAERTARDIAQLMRPDPRFTRIKLYAWPMEGVVIVFKGSVSNVNDLAALKSIVDQKRGSTPVKWNIDVSTNETP